jgi:hypothetical protein
MEVSSRPYPSHQGNSTWGTLKRACMGHRDAVSVLEKSCLTLLRTEPQIIQLIAWTLYSCTAATGLLLLTSCMKKISCHVATICNTVWEFNANAHPAVQSDTCSYTLQYNLTHVPTPCSTIWHVFLHFSPQILPTCCLVALPTLLTENSSAS